MNKITLFIGLNDKDTKVQEITTVEARAILADRIAQKIGFGTVSLASGVYTHETERPLLKIRSAANSTPKTTRR